LGQTCPNGWEFKNVISATEAQFSYCVEPRPGNLGQQIFIGYRINFRSYKEVRFTVVIKTTCGNEIKKKIYLPEAKSGVLYSGGGFFGEIYMGFSIWKEDCNNPENRIAGLQIVDYTFKVDEDISSTTHDEIQTEDEERIMQLEEKQRTQNEKTSKVLEEKESIQSRTKKEDDDDNEATPYIESESDRQRRLRMESLINRDWDEDQTMTTAITNTAGVMTSALSSNMDNDDEDDELFSYLKGTIGLGLNHIPVLSNLTLVQNNLQTGGNKVTYSTKIGNTNHPVVSMGMMFSMFNNTFISFRIQPFASLGLNAFESNVSGTHLTYGGYSALGFGRRFKFLLKGGYAWRNGNVTYDNILTGRDESGTSSYDYSTLQYGAGLYWGFEGHDFFAEISAYKENVSFLKNRKSDVYSYEIKLSFTYIALVLQFTPNYPIAGELKYFNITDRKKQGLWIASLYVPFKIFSID